MVLLWDGQVRGISWDTLTLAITVPLVYGASNTYIRWQLADSPVLLMTAIVLLIGAVSLLPVIVAMRIPLVPSRSGHGVMESSVMSLFWLSVVGTGLAGAAFVRLIQSEGPLYAGMASYLVPLVAIVWGMVDGEPISIRQWVAMLSVLAMVFVVHRR